jgi:hypothetical protein
MQGTVYNGDEMDVVLSIPTKCGTGWVSNNKDTTASIAQSG